MRIENQSPEILFKIYSEWQHIVLYVDVIQYLLRSRSKINYDTFVRLIDHMFRLQLKDFSTFCNFINRLRNHSYFRHIPNTKTEYIFNNQELRKTVGLSESLPNLHNLTDKLWILHDNVHLVSKYVFQHIFSKHGKGRIRIYDF